MEAGDLYSLTTHDHIWKFWIQPRWWTCVNSSLTDWNKPVPEEDSGHTFFKHIFQSRFLSHFFSFNLKKQTKKNSHLQKPTFFLHNNFSFGCSYSTTRWINWVAHLSISSIHLRRSSSSFFLLSSSIRLQVWRASCPRRHFWKVSAAQRRSKNFLLQ